MLSSSVACSRDQLTKPLGGYEPFYALKFNTDLTVPGDWQSKLWRSVKHTDTSVTRVKGKEKEVIPLRRDDEEGGLFIDYIFVKQGTSEQSMLLNRVVFDRQDERSNLTDEKIRLHIMPAEVVKQVESAMDEVERANASLREGGPLDANETQRQMHGNDIHLPAQANPTGDGKVYEMVIGRHPDE